MLIVVGREALAQPLEQRARRAPRSTARVCAARRAHQLLGLHRPALRHPRQHHDARAVDVDDAPARAAAGSPSTVMPSRANTGATDSSCDCWSWLPPTTTTCAPVSRSASSASYTTAVGLGRRRGRLVEVADDEDEVGALAVGDLGDLAEHGAVLVEARRAAQQLADVPVGGVERSSPARPSARAARLRARSSGMRARRPRPGSRPARRAGRPRRERELDDERHRDLGLVHEHRARLGDHRPLLVHRRAGTRTRAAPPRPRRAGRRRGSTSWR